MAPKKNRKVISKRKSQSKLWLAIIVIVLVIAGVAIYAAVGNQPAPPATIDPTKVLLETTAGNITIDLRTDKPITSGNFINLVQQGKYDGSSFHRVVDGFMIQGGQISGTVPAIQDEIGNNNHNTNYTIAMAKTSQPNSATSEFFINVVDNSNRYPTFDPTYAVFGTVIAGQEVVDAISKAPTTENPNIPGEMSIPINPVVITRATIIQ
jgi:cyclophilin family peptidyl-prolyl cis-trans isomerase